MFFFGVKVSWNLVFFPLVVCIQFIFMYGMALFLSATAIRFRDLLYVVLNLIMLWFFLTPILYPILMVAEEYQGLIYLNPMADLIMAYQDIFYYNRIPSLPGLSIMAFLSCVMMMIGFWFFEARRNLFAEEV
jgi:ABC-type polysaccharide/polyol phosphate export permease